MSLLLAAAAACTSRGPARATPLGTRPLGATETAQIPSLGLVLEVPTGTEIAYVSSGATFYTRPEARNPRAFSIEEWPSPALHSETPGPRVTRTLGGARLEYEVQRSEGGSGSAEAHLAGKLSLGGGAVYAVHCHDQAEPPAEPDPSWCVELLSTVRRVAR